MLNPVLASAIQNFTTANFAIPETAPDEVMNTAVLKAVDYMACVIAIRARTDLDVLAKLAFAATLEASAVEWVRERAKLVKGAVADQNRIEANKAWDEGRREAA